MAPLLPTITPRFVSYSSNSSSSLGTGAIAGIVIISFLFVVAITSICIRRRQTNARYAAASATGTYPYYGSHQHQAHQGPQGQQAYPMTSGGGYGYRTADGQPAPPAAVMDGRKDDTAVLGDVPPAYSPPGQYYNVAERNDGVIR